MEDIKLLKFICIIILGLVFSHQLNAQTNTAEKIPTQSLVPLSDTITADYDFESRSIEKLDSIIALLKETKKPTLLLRDTENFKKENTSLMDSIVILKDSIGNVQKRLNEAKAQSDLLGMEVSKLKSDTADLKKDLTTSNKKQINILSEETRNLNQEIYTVITLSYKVPDSLLIIIENRIKTLKIYGGEAPSGASLFLNFVQQRNEILSAEELLDVPYDNIVEATVSVLSNQEAHEEFTQLNKDRERMKKLLKNYCSKTSSIKELFDETKVIAENERKNELYIAIDLHESYPYLKEIIRKVIDDKNINPLSGFNENCSK